MEILAKHSVSKLIWKIIQKIEMGILCFSFLDATASPSTYPCQSVSQSVRKFQIGDRIFQLCELVEEG